MACGRVVVSREVVVESVLCSGCGCCVGVVVRVEWVLPWWGWYVFRGGAGVFFFEVVL